MKSHLEIERKYLLKSLPKALEKHPRLRDIWHVRQAYIEASGKEVRLRSIEKFEKGEPSDHPISSFVLTAKDNGTLVRQESETDISEQAFDLLLPLAGRRVLLKTRYRVEEEGYLWEIDAFEGALSGIVFAEVEMKSAQEHPELPHWIKEVLNRDVTEEAGWSNSELTRKFLDYKKELS